MALDVFGNVLLAGSVKSVKAGTTFYESTLSGTEDAFVLRCGPDGTLDWSKLLGSPVADRAQSIAADAAGNAVIAGITDGQVGEDARVGGEDLFVAMFTASGILSWTAQLGSVASEDGAGVAVGPGGAIVTVASTTGLVNGLPNAGAADVFVTRFVSDCVGLSLGADFRCPPGHFCTPGMVNLEDGRCPRGTYSPYYSLANVSQCLMCPRGSYCDTLGATAVTAPCAAGYYCTGGAADEQAGTCDIRSLVCDTPSCEAMHGVAANASCGGTCTAGNYCPEGSYQETPCTAGSYCGDPALGNVSGLCNPGYYCKAGSDSAFGISYNQSACPQGSYCPAGTADPNSCPRGTSSAGRGMVSVDDCLKCEAGYYCPFSEGGNNLDGLTNKKPCTPRYYCPAGSTNASLLCPRGHYCGELTAQPAPCIMGQYQDVIGHTSCKTCFAGAYCPGVETFDSEAGLITDRSDGGAPPCIKGHYCPANTASPIPCSPGTYNPTTHSTNDTACLQCLLGHHCNETGLPAPSGPCSPGFYCPAGTALREPEQYICPRGYGCPEGSAEPEICREGTFSTHPGAHHCTMIVRGFYLKLAGVIDLGWSYAEMNLTNRTEVLAAIADATAQYVCLGSGYAAISVCTNPTRNIMGLCDDGYYCVAGSHTPVPQASLSSGMSYGYAYGDICPVGHRCPSGSGAPIPCSAGLYQGETAKPDCKTIPRGLYATAGDKSVILTCPLGHYCPEGEPTSPIPCPLSTFGNLSSAYALAHCHKCPPGMYCASPGIGLPSGLCGAGFICPTASCTSPTGQRLDSPSTVPCPRGYFCPAGSSRASACPAGTYNTNPNASSLDNCVPCPSGTYCNFEGSGATDQPVTCSAGYYCQVPSTTKTVVSILAALNPPSWGGIATPATTLTKQIGHVTGSPPTFRCPRGFKCPAGTPAPLECCHGATPDSFNFSCAEYQPDAGKADCVLCPAGFRCAQPQEGAGYALAAIPCPKNHYCPKGSLPIPCMPGTYTSFTNLTSQSGCFVCPAGKWCDNGVVMGACTRGYICLRGSVCSTPGAAGACPAVRDGTQLLNGQCPVGAYCPEETERPLLCPAGSLQPTSPETQNPKP
ncbi:hypothetical protein T484DRAFT_2850924 [Baffinella frigidus]|nr:hypothetical protein T484DRAFT_2850924 [Cryptophyta sp. CCMP2293]